MITFITKQCIVCHKTSSVELDLEKFSRWQSGELIQKVWPEMSLGQREVLISGTHSECWRKLFNNEEGDQE